MTAATIHTHLRDAAETEALAQQIAPQLGPGDTLFLQGDIGAGKTVFARALIQARLAAIDKWEDVPSPTFTIVQTYEAGDVEIWHTDLYRLTGAADIDELGLQDAFGQAIVLVEWPDRLGDAAPRDPLVLHFTIGGAGEGRDLTISGDAERWQRVFAALTGA